MQITKALQTISEDKHPVRLPHHPSKLLAVPDLRETAEFASSLPRLQRKNTACLKGPDQHTTDLEQPPVLEIEAKKDRREVDVD